MNGKIAIFMKDAIEEDSFVLVMAVVVFEKTLAEWTEKERHYVNLRPSDSLANIRRELCSVIDRLGDCRIAAGDGISGVLYGELNSRGYAIFEIKDCSPDTLSGILADIIDAQKDNDAVYVPTTPVETDSPGVYTLDLIRLQEAHPEITSKQALQSFLEKTPFFELQLLCTHLPPWLEAGAYEITAQPCGLHIRATIHKKQCRGGT